MSDKEFITMCNNKWIQELLEGVECESRIYCVDCDKIADETCFNIKKCDIRGFKVPDLELLLGLCSEADHRKVLDKMNIIGIYDTFTIGIEQLKILYLEALYWALWGLIWDADNRKWRKE